LTASIGIPSTPPFHHWRQAITRNTFTPSKQTNMKQLFFIAIILLAVSAGWAGSYQAAATTAKQSGIKRTELQRHDLSTAGREAVQVRIDFAAGSAFGQHSHPGEEIIYVLEGTLEYQVNGEAPVTLKAGEVLFIPAGKVHAAKNVSSGNATELATYVVEKGKPLVVPAR
jgi:quercetin dioxygenase-like cupin family protein